MRRAGTGDRRGWVGRQPGNFLQQTIEVRLLALELLELFEVQGGLAELAGDLSVALLIGRDRALQASTYAPGLFQSAILLRKEGRELVFLALQVLGFPL